MMSALPKPPPIPPLCPHSQSKTITLYYRLQTGPVNTLPLGCWGMHLNGRSLLRISARQCASGPPWLQKSTTLLVKSLNPMDVHAWGAGLDPAAVQGSLDGELGFCSNSHLRVWRCFFFNEFPASCWCTAALLTKPIATWPSDLALQAQGDRQSFAPPPTLITANCKTLPTRASELKPRRVLFESGADYLCTTAWKREASGFVACGEVRHQVLPRPRPREDPTTAEMSVNCSFTSSCLHTVATISLWHAHPAYSAAAPFPFLILPAAARVHAPR